MDNGVIELINKEANKMKNKHLGSLLIETGQELDAEILARRQYFENHSSQWQESSDGKKFQANYQKLIEFRESQFTREAQNIIFEIVAK